MTFKIVEPGTNKVLFGFQGMPADHPIFSGGKPAVADTVSLQRLEIGQGQAWVFTLCGGRTCADVVRDS